MLLKFDTQKLNVNNSFSAQSKTTQKQSDKPLSHNGNKSKILLGLAGLAVLGISCVNKSKAALNAKHADKITNIRYEGQKAINNLFAGNNFRNADAVEAYKKAVAEKKAAVLEYKINNNLLGNKTMFVKEKIVDNLNKLKGTIA